MPVENSGQTLPLAVLLDANLWYADPLLRGPSGAILLYQLRRQGARLALVDVLEREIRKNLYALAEQKADQIEEGVRFFAHIFNENLCFTRPTPTDLDSAFRVRLEELGTLLIRAELRPSHFEKALDRVMAGMPPSGRENEQFKDSLIWEAALELAATHQVLFTTKDKAFYKKRDYGAGLADNLLCEAQDTAGKIKIYSGLSECLDALKAEAKPVDLKTVISLLDPHVRAKVAAMHNNPVLGERTKENVKLYFTDVRGRLGAKFELSYMLISLGADVLEGTDSSAIVRGACFYKEGSDAVSDVEVTEVVFGLKDFVLAAHPRGARELAYSRIEIPL